MGNLNMFQKPVDDIFFEALSEININDISDLHVSIEGDYVDIGRKKYERFLGDDLFYDGRTKRLMPEKEWLEKCGDFTFDKEREHLCILKNAGILHDYLNIIEWLQKNDTIKTRDYDEIDGKLYEKVAERELRYGYKIIGITFSNGSVVWKIVLYDRAIKENRLLNGSDYAYLTFDEIVYEVYEVDDDKIKDTLFKKF